MFFVAQDNVPEQLAMYMIMNFKTYKIWQLLE
jgi:hypothetical protein